MNKDIKKEGRRSIQGLLDKDKTELIGMLLKSLAIIRNLTPESLRYIAGMHHEDIKDLQLYLAESDVDKDDAYHNFLRFGQERFYACLECGRWSSAMMKCPCGHEFTYRVCWGDFE